RRRLVGHRRAGPRHRAGRAGAGAAQLHLRRDRQPAAALGTGAVALAQAQPAPHARAGAGAMSEALLSIRNLSVDYLLEKGAFRAVKDVSFDIGRGELFGLAGESGCGKSTIAYAITRLAKPPAWVAGGEILLEGQDLLKLSESALQKVRWRRIGMVF